MWLPTIYVPTGDGICNLGTCPDQELNPQTFGAQDDIPTKGATWPGLLSNILMLLKNMNDSKISTNN